MLRSNIAIAFAFAVATSATMTPVLADQAPQPVEVFQVATNEVVAPVSTAPEFQERAFSIDTDATISQNIRGLRSAVRTLKAERREAVLAVKASDMSKAEKRAAIKEIRTSFRSQISPLKSDIKSLRAGDSVKIDAYCNYHDKGVVSCQ